MSFSAINSVLRRSAPLPAALSLLCAVVSNAQETSETDALRERVAALEKSLVDADKQILSLTESLAAANGESGTLREDYERLRAQSEALGLSALKGESGLQERLLAAMNELSRLKEENTSLSKLLDTLYTASREALNQADPAAPFASALSAALTDTENHYRAQAEMPRFAAKDVHKAKVIAMKPDLGLVILNVGRGQGVKPGMPLQIVRKDQPIAPAIVVEVRDQICGAICQANPDIFQNVRLGDGVTVELSR